MGRGCERIDLSMRNKCNYDFNFQGCDVFVTLHEMFWEIGQKKENLKKKISTVVLKAPAPERTFVFQRPYHT